MPLPDGLFGETPQGKTGGLPDDLFGAWQPTEYGFKVKPAVLPNGAQTLQREDGAVHIKASQDPRFKGQEGWHFLDPKTGVFVPAPAKPQAQMGFLENQIESTKQLGRNLYQGLTRPADGLRGLAHDIAYATGMEGEKPYLEALGEIDAAERYRKAMANTGGGLATVQQITGEALPMVAMTAATPAAAPTRFATAEAISPTIAPFVQRAAANALPAGLTTYATTPGRQSERVKAAAITTAAAPLLQGGVEGLGNLVGGALTKARKIGATKSAQEMLDELGARFGGQSPGEALQNAAQAKYDQKWEQFRKIVEPLDAEAGGATVDYSPAIGKLQELLGVGRKRNPVSMPDERRKLLKELLSDLEDSMTPEGEVSNSFSGAIDVVKRLGAEQRRLARVHGDTEAREMLGEVRDAVLASMDASNPGLSEQARASREYFAREIVPLFDKSEGGNFLTQIRDSATPGDLLVSSNQGALTRVKPDKAAIIAKGSSPDPMLYSVLDAAIKQADGKPGVFTHSINKAMPMIEKIADKETLAAFRGLAEVSRDANTSGMVANLAAGAMIPNQAIGAAGALSANLFAKGITGPGLMWKLLQNPNARKVLAEIGRLPAGSPAIRPLTSKLTAIASTKEFRNVEPLITRGAQPPAKIAQNENE